MQNIHVNRYNHYVGYRGHGYLGWVEPEDRSWILFITKDSTPVLMLKTEQSVKDPDSAHKDGTRSADGTVEYVYMEANALIDGSGDKEI